MCASCSAFPSRWCSWPLSLSTTGRALPSPSAIFWLWIFAGAFTQIFGTALMLMTMTERSFVVSIAYLKTEPIQVAAMGLVFLGDPLRLPTIAAILVATAGVAVISWKPGASGGWQPAP